MSQRELATASGVTEQTMSRVLARMERTRLRHADAARRRPAPARHHDHGRGPRRRFFVASDRELAEAMVTRGLTPEQAEQLRRLLVVVASEPDDGRDRTAGSAG